MSRYLVDPERSRFSVRFRPSLAGLVATVTGIRGEFEATIDDHATVDWDAPLRGSFTLDVDDAAMANPLATFAVRQFLERTRNDAVRGAIDEVTRTGDRSFRGTATIHLNGRSVPVPATGRFTAIGRDTVEVVGTSQADPAAFGVPLPPLINFAVLTSWTIVLTPG